MDQTKDNSAKASQNGKDPSSPADADQVQDPFAQLKRLSSASLSGHLNNPEAQVLEKSYKSGAHQERIIALIREYLRVSAAAESSYQDKSSAEWLNLAANPQLDYFTRLQHLKAASLAGGPAQQPSILSAIRDTYAHSGSAELAYAAAKDCILNDDFSHEALFAAVRAAKESGVTAELYYLLEGLWVSGNHTSKSVPERLPLAYHIYSLARELNETATARHFASEINALARNSPEAHIVLAHSQLENSDYDTAFANAWAARKLSKSTCPALIAHAYSAAIEADCGMGGSRKDSLRTRLLAEDKENRSVWKEVLAPMIGDAASGAILWSAVDTRLNDGNSSAGYLAAAEELEAGKAWHSLSVADKQRVRSYLEKSYEKDPFGVAALVELRRIALAEEDVSAAEDYGKQAATRAPHHPKLPDSAVAASLSSTAAAATTLAKAPTASLVTPNPSQWDKTIEAQIQQAYKAGGVFRDALAHSCPVYKSIQSSLDIGSGLRAVAAKSISEVAQFSTLAETAAAGASMTSKAQFAARLGGIGYDLRETTQPALTGALNTLYEYLIKLDPAFKPLKKLDQGSSIRRVATNAYAAHTACSTVFDQHTSSGAQKQAALSALAKALKDAHDELQQITASTLDFAAEVVDEWASKVEGLLAAPPAP